LGGDYPHTQLFSVENETLPEVVKAVYKGNISESILYTVLNNLVCSKRQGLWTDLTQYL
jgi:hypothetical protein